jgi:hypothetical protein
MATFLLLSEQGGLEKYGKIPHLPKTPVEKPSSQFLYPIFKFYLHCSFVVSQFFQHLSPDKQKKSWRKINFPIL